MENEHSIEDFDRVRLDAEWTALNALRELLQLATKGRESVSYENGIALGKELLPKLFEHQKSLIAKGLEPPAVREYRQMADVQGRLLDKVVDPIEFIDRDIRECEALLIAEGHSREISRRLDRLLNYRRYFAGEYFSEHQLIRRDAFQAQRGHLPNRDFPGNYTEYKLKNGRALRIRMLHPDKPEHSTGADLIYEVCSEPDEVARFAFLQYKVWEDDVLYFSKASGIAGQLAKMSDVMCSNGFCDSDSKPTQANYRLPHCAAFLRLTDKLQKPDARLVSTGLHVPVCVVLESAKRSAGGQAIIRRSDIEGKCVSSETFEQLFHDGMLGSRWIPYQQVEKLYRQHGILNSHERITMYAQEF